jgi:HSP20 family molecular chaperone IbpA
VIKFNGFIKKENIMSFLSRNGLVPWRDDFISNVEHEINGMLDKVLSKDFFEGMKDSGFPIADAYSNENHLYIQFPVAGVHPSDLEVYEEDGKLVVKGFIEKRSEDFKHHLKEWKRGAFKRMFKLPDNVEGDPHARLENGILTVAYSLVKEQEPETGVKKIEIEVNDRYKKVAKDS